MPLEQQPGVRAYLDTVCSLIKWREAHPSVKAELLSHLEETVAELRDDGLGEQEAVEAALHRLGNAAELGRQLNTVHVPVINWPLLAATASLSALGLAMIYTLEAAGALAEIPHVFLRSLIYSGLGAMALFFLQRYDLRRLRPYAVCLYAGTLGLWLAALIWGPSFGGKHFIALGPVHIDYAGLTPYLLAVCLSGILADLDLSKKRGLFIASAFFAGPFFLFIMSGSLPLTLMYTVVFLALMAAAGVGRARIAALLAFSVGLLGLACLAGFGGQESQVAETAASFHTDFAFLYLLREFGWPAAAAVGLLAALLLAILVLAALRIRDRFGRLTVAGLTACFTVQMTWHVLMSLGLLPPASMNLPLVSFGGSQTVVQLAALGAILGIYKRKNYSSPSRMIN